MRALFQNEAVAYERLKRYPELAVYTPEYHGRRDPCALATRLGFPSDRYVSACGLVLEQIPGTDTKIARLDPPDLQAAAIKVLEDIHDRIDPGNVWDCSCFVPGSRADFTFIDFALWEGYADFFPILADRGYFSHEQRVTLKRSGEQPGT